MKTQKGILELCLIIIVVICIHAKRFFQDGSAVSRNFPTTLTPSLTDIRNQDSVMVKTNNLLTGMEIQPGDWKSFYAVRALRSPDIENREKARETGAPNRVKSAMPNKNSVRF